eukprot:g35906.t1
MIIYKFENHTIVVGWISNSNETEYRKEKVSLAAWCTDNQLFHNVSKMKELIIAVRKWSGGHAPVCIIGVDVEVVESFKFLGILITSNPSWSIHVNAMVKKA